MIRPARVSDIEAMQRVDAAAGRRFAEIDDPRVAACADDPPLPTDALRRWVDDGRAWVAETTQAQVVGAAVVDILDGNAHVEEVSVEPDAERRGIGSDLLAAVAAYARREGHPAVTLTTFAAVPWNRPWYERRGFTVLARGEIGPELAARIRREADDGLDPALRVAMRRPVAG